MHPQQRKEALQPGYCTKAPRDTGDSVYREAFGEYPGELQVVPYRAAIVSSAIIRDP
jgi:hypothetical protein